MTITKLNKIIDDYKKREKILKEENLDLKNKIKILEERLKKKR